MGAYLTIIVQIIRVAQNTIQLRRQNKLIKAQLYQLDDVTKDDFNMQRKAYRLIVEHFEHIKQEG